MNQGGMNEGEAKAKKGLSKLAWVGIGCGTLLFIGIIAAFSGGALLLVKWWDKIKVLSNVASNSELWEEQPALAASKIIATFNPELEVVEVDEDKGTITVRKKETGEQFTVDLEDVKKGRISVRSGDQEMVIQGNIKGDGGSLTITGDEGETKYTGGDSAGEDIPDWIPEYPGTERTGFFSTRNEQGIGGSFGAQTSDKPDKVLEYFKESLEAGGFEVRVTSYSQKEMSGGIVAAQDEENQRMVQIHVQRDQETTQLSVTYQSGS